MKRVFLSGTLAFISVLSLQLFSQVSISSDASPPHVSAMLDIKSTVSGLLVPRMTLAQRNAIVSPATGLLIYQTDIIQGYYYYSGMKWVPLTDAGGNSPSTCIDYDGNAYPTFTIGTQTWMAKNLQVTHYRNGEAIPHLIDNSAWASSYSGAYCWFDNDEATNAKYGALYNWYAVNNSSGLCPQGWHVPSNEEWNTLKGYLGGYNAGGKMKSVSAHWFSPNTNATDDSGFSGLPGGSRNGTGWFGSLGYFGHFWSSWAILFNTAWDFTLTYNDPYLSQIEKYKASGFSVRCLRD